MLVTMTGHFWQQTQSCITKKSDENVAIKVYIVLVKWQNPAFLTNILMKSALIDERTMTFLATELFEA